MKEPSIPPYIRKLNHLTIYEKWLYLCLKDLSGEDMTCAYTLRTLQKETGIAISTLSNIIHKLQDADLIEAHKGYRSTGGKEIWHITVKIPADIDLQAIEQRYTVLPKNKRLQERDKVLAQLKRASDANLSATLTIDEWLQTLNDFDWKCAYCGGKYQLIEHFIPLVLGGGTTQKNCIPGCLACNRKKHGHHPLLIPASTGMKEAIHQVQEYLSTIEVEE